MIVAGQKEIEKIEPTLTTEEYVECLEDALMEIYKGTDKGPRFVGCLIHCLLLSHCYMMITVVLSL